MLSRSYLLILSILIVFSINENNGEDSDSEAESSETESSEAESSDAEPEEPEEPKTVRAETLLRRKIENLNDAHKRRPMILEDGSRLEIPKFEKFGSGAFAFTLRGKLNDKIDVAIKFALKDSEADLKREYLMYEKIGATSDINCEKKGIPFIHYFGRITHYYDVIILTLLDENLHDKFEHMEGKFTREYQLRVFKSLLSSLEYIHDKGIFHRDLKDANVMERKRDGRIFLIDFDMAKEESEHQDVAGSPLFVSGDSCLDVENHQQNQIDDLFSLSHLMFYFGGLNLPWTALCLSGDFTLESLGESKNDKDRYHRHINTLPYPDLRRIHRSFYNEIWDRRADKKRFNYQVHINRIDKALTSKPK